MTDLLQKLFAAKSRALGEELAREPLEELERRAAARLGDRRSFGGALTASRGPAIVAEIKRASPSKGLIARNFDPAGIAAEYDRAGADAISVLTEADHFLGELGFLDVARRHSRCPILRKDFLSTRYQIVQSAAYGADAVLLIVAGLLDTTLASLLDECKRWSLDALVEVHDESELQRALGAHASIVGINNRDLRTFETNLDVTEYLLPSVPSSTLVVSESGLSGPGDIARLFALGARAFLVGEALMRADEPAALIGQLKTGSVPA